MVPKLWESTEEGQKVVSRHWPFVHILSKFNVPCPLPWILTSISAQVTRNMGTGANHGDGAKWCAVFERVEDPHQLPS